MGLPFHPCLCCQRGRSMSMMWGFQGSVGKLTCFLQAHDSTWPPIFLSFLGLQPWTKAGQKNEICALSGLARSSSLSCSVSKKSGTPILFIIDGHASHKTPKMQQLCYATTVILSRSYHWSWVSGFVPFNALSSELSLLSEPSLHHPTNPSIWAYVSGWSSLLFCYKFISNSGKFICAAI